MPPEMLQHVQRPPTIMFASAYRQLTPAERIFVDGVVNELETGAIRAGERISVTLYRPIPDHIVAQSRGHLDSPMVRAAITERINEIAAESELTHERLLKEMRSIAFSNFGDYITMDDENGIPMFDLTRCTPEQMAAIKSIDVEETGGFERGKRKFKITLHDKMTGIKMLAEYMGLLDADNPHWRKESAKPDALPADASTQQAGDRYAAMINGGG